MFDEILNLVKEHLGNNPQISSAIPAGQEDAVHREIANHVTNSNYKLINLLFVSVCNPIHPLAK